MKKVKLLDLFCGAGGCAMGYWRAGYHDITGIDHRYQKRYPFDFVQADVFEWCAENDLSQFDLIHASPPCQKYTRMNRGLLQAQGKNKDHPDYIDIVRKILKDLPHVIENVPGSPLENTFLLCGSMFGLLVRRHRLFESSYFIMVPDCQHEKQKGDFPALHRLQGKSNVVGCYGHGRGKGDNIALWKKAMGITWMNRPELTEAIPPAYTEWIGKQIINYEK
jgi:DNA (cytosine-5)-methyltransferase 1